MTVVEILLIALVALWFAVIIWLEVSSRNRGESEEEKEAVEGEKGDEPIHSGLQETPKENAPEAPAAASKEPKSEEAPEAAEVPDILCQFIFNGKGEKVGETIAVDDSLVVIKAKEKYYAVPFKHVETKDGRLTVVGVTDWAIAEQLAEKWKEKSSKLT